MSVRSSAWKTSAPTRRIFTKFDFSVFFEILLRYFNLNKFLTRINGTPHEDLSRSMFVSSSVLLRIRNFSEQELCRKSKQIFFFKSGLYEMTWKSMVQPSRPHIAIWRMHIWRWIHKATNTHSEYVLIIAFPLQQLLHECASTLRCSKLPVLFCSGWFYLSRSAHR